MRPSARIIALPIAIPVGFATLLLAVFAGGNVNIHGGIGALILFSGFSGVAVAIWELIAVPWAVTTLIRNPEFRSRLNIAAASVGVLYLIAVYFAYLYLQHAGISRGQP